MRYRVPANIDMADRIIGGLTLRQLVILGIDGLTVWLLFFAIGERVGLPVFGALAAPLAAAGIVIATTRIEGLWIERLAVHAARFFSTPRRRVLRSAPIIHRPRWLPGADKVASVPLPVSAVDSSGLVDLGEEGAVLIARATSINFGLRSEDEQRLLVEGFARVLNGLDGPIQLVVRAEPADLDASVADIERDAPSLPHQDLERAACEHAAFLRSLSGRSDVLRRRILVCFRDPRSPAESAVSLARRLEETQILWRGIGVKVERLDAGQAVDAIAQASGARRLDPTRQQLPGGVIR